MIFRSKKYNFIQSQYEERDRLRLWHYKFAWLPIRVDDEHAAWLQYVLRRYPEAEVYKADCYSIYRHAAEYKLPPNRIEPLNPWPRRIVRYDKDGVQIEEKV